MTYPLRRPTVRRFLTLRYLRARGLTVFGERERHTSPTVRVLDPEEDVFGERHTPPTVRVLNPEQDVVEIRLASQATPTLQASRLGSATRSPGRQPGCPWPST